MCDDGIGVDFFVDDVNCIVGCFDVGVEDLFVGVYVGECGE